MATSQAEQHLSLIREMIEKTRQDTTQSGHFFLVMGCITLAGTVGVHLLEARGLQKWTLPTVILMAVVNAMLAFLIGLRERNGIKSYTKTLFWHTWMACGVSALLVTFLFPRVGLYPVSAVPALASLLMGIGLFLSGALTELTFLKWSGAAWCTGACLMAAMGGRSKFWVMVAVLVLGWILPGILLNRLQKKGRTP